MVFHLFIEFFIFKHESIQFDRLFNTDKMFSFNCFSLFEFETIELKAQHSWSNFHIFALCSLDIIDCFTIYFWIAGLFLWLYLIFNLIIINNSNNIFLPRWVNFIISDNINHNGGKGFFDGLFTNFYVTCVCKSY